MRQREREGDKKRWKERVGERRLGETIINIW